MDSSCVLKVELKRLADELDVECKGKRTNPVFGPSSWMQVLLNEMGRTRLRAGSGWEGEDEECIVHSEY